VVAKHDFFFDGVIQLGGGTIMAIDYAKWVGGFFTNFFGLKEMVTPRLVPKIQDFFQSRAVTNSAKHNEQSSMKSLICLRLKQKNTFLNMQFARR
jgi:hypothetical protein